MRLSHSAKTPPSICIRGKHVSKLRNRAIFRIAHPRYEKSITIFRDNPETKQELFVNDLDSVKRSSFNPNNPTRFATHGWRGNTDAGSACLLIRDGRIVVIASDNLSHLEFKFISRCILGINLILRISKFPIQIGIRPSSKI